MTYDQYCRTVKVQDDMFNAIERMNVSEITYGDLIKQPMKVAKSLVVEAANKGIGNYAIAETTLGLYESMVELSVFINKAVRNERQSVNLDPLQCWVLECLEA